MRMTWRSMFANLADEFFLNLHLLAKLPPYLSQSQLVVCVNETIESDNMKLVFVVFRHVCYNRLDQLDKSRQLLSPRVAGVVLTVVLPHPRAPMTSIELPSPATIVCSTSCEAFS